MGDDITTLKVKKKDKESMKRLSCAEFGMTCPEVFEIMTSFCLKEKDRLKKWKNKKEKE